MKRINSDDWGTPLGGDPAESLKTPTSKKTSMTSLVYYFKDSLPLDAMSRIGSPVNGPALMKGFKKLIESGFTPDDIRGMIDIFIVKIKTKPLSPSIVPWRAFLADLDSLSVSYRQMNPQEDYGKWGIDSRLLEDK